MLAADSPERDDPPPEEKGVAREIKLRGVRLGKAGKDVTRPTKITSKEELVRAIPDKDVQKRLNKDVDFSKDVLLLFVWTASAEDSLEPKEEKKEDRSEVIFTYIAGRNPEKTRHVRLFKLPKDIKWKVDKKR
jgi:hypothetical protein